MDQDLTERAARERAAYDSKAVPQENARLQHRFSHVFACPNSKLIESTLGTRLAALVPGADVLDYGCYTGRAADRLLPLGPRSLTGIDISGVAITEARERYGNQAEFAVMDACGMSFPDDTFDLVVGRAILHHLDFEQAISEIGRVLRPGGRALFVEPLRDNPLAKLYRVVTPRARTTDELPLSRRQLEFADEAFGAGSHVFAGLASVPVGMASSFVSRNPANAAMRAADGIDRALANTAARYWMRIVLLEWEKRRESYSSSAK